MIAKRISIVALLILVSASTHAAQWSQRETLSGSELSWQATAEGWALDFAGSFPVARPGEADLPGRLIRVPMPAGERLAGFEFVQSAPRSLPLEGALRPAPPLLDEAGVPAPFSNSGEEPASLRLLGELRGSGRRVAVFLWQPLALADGQLLLHEELELQLRSEVDPEPPLHRLRSGNEGGVNAGGPFVPRERPSLDGSPVDAVIVTTAAMEPAFAILAEWHLARGTRTVVRNVDWIAANYPPGRDRGENIRFFLQDAYQLWGLQALIIGGDTTDIPTRYMTSRASGEVDEVPTDTYYSCLDGNWNADGDVYWAEAPFGEEPGDDADIEPELLVGRLPVSTFTQAQDLVQKLMNYRETGAGNFQDQILFLAEVLFPADWIPGEEYWMDGASYAVGVMDSLLSPAMQPTPLFENWQDPLYSLYNPSPLSVEAAFDAMDSGDYAFVDQNGHGFRYNMSVGNGSIVINDAQDLRNDVPFHISLMNCTSTAYDFDCLGENFLRNPQGGAMAVLGTTRSSYPTLSYPFQVRYYKEIFEAGRRRPGEAMYHVRQATAPLSLEEGYQRWTYFILAFLGDPLLDLWSGSPRSLSVELIDDPVTVGDEPLQFHVESGGQPVVGARLTLMKGGEVWSTGTSDAGGDCLLPARLLTPGSMTLNAWADNAWPLSQDFQVQAGSGPFVYVESLVIDDSPAGGLVNNGDGHFDAGEQVRLVPTLRNGGDSAASGLSLSLAAIDAGLLVVDGDEIFADLPAGAAAAGAGELEVGAELSVADGSLLRLLADLSWSGDSRQDSLVMDLRAPRLVLAEWRLSDEVPYGDGDGIFEESEHLHAQPRWVNLGGGVTGEVEATLNSLSPPDLVIHQDQVTIASLGLLEDARPEPGFEIELADPGQEYFARLVTTDAFGRSQVDTLEFQRPEAPTNLVADASLAPDRIELSWEPSVSVDVAGYHVYFAQGEIEDYERYTLLPAPHGALVLENLLENSLTHLYVTAVDDGGMESPPSAILHTSTNPGQLSGFPQLLGGSSTTSVGVANIAGDESLELVTAADYLYAWHHNGIEVRDGDSEASTYGVFSTQAADIPGPITLLPLQGSQYRQIVVASRGSNPSGFMGIHVFDGDGDYLPGWPRETLDWIWTSPVGADMDGDGDLEILGMDKNGNLYGFHHDGSELVDGDNNPSTYGLIRAHLGNWPNGGMAAGDLDGNGTEEIVFVAGGGHLAGQLEYLYAIQADGSDLPGFPVSLDTGALNDDARTRAALLLANFDGDPAGDLEIIFQTVNHSLHVYDKTGTPWAGYPLGFICNTPYMGPGPLPVDLDDDGDLELLVVETLGNFQSNLHLIHHDGSPLAGWPVSFPSDAQSSPVAGDLDGDGQMEFIIGTETGIIYGFKEDGSAQPGFPISVGGELRGTPALADLDHDGDIELLASSWNRRVMVWDFPGPFNEASCPWPTVSGNYFRTGRYGDWDNVPVLLSELQLELVSGGVDLGWTAGDPEVQRWSLRRESRAEGEAWAEGLLLSEELPRQGDRVLFRDEKIQAERRYRYFARAHWGEGRSEEIFLGEIAVGADPYRDRLVGAYPNPFNPSTTLVFELAQDGPAALEILSIQGRRLRRLQDGPLTAGRHERIWDGRDETGRSMASGIYLARLIQPGRVQSQRLVLLK